MCLSSKTRCTSSTQSSSIILKPNTRIWYNHLMPILAQISLKEVSIIQIRIRTYPLNSNKIIIIMANYYNNNTKINLEIKCLLEMTYSSPIKILNQSLKDQVDLTKVYPKTSSRDKKTPSDLKSLTLITIRCKSKIIMESRPNYLKPRFNNLVNFNRHQSSSRK